MIDYLTELRKIAEDDVKGLHKAQESYGDSWCQRGGIGAFMMAARKWDRLEKQVQNSLPGVDKYDIFDHIENDARAEGIIDDIRDLRRYLLLIEAYMIAKGIKIEQQRDNRTSHPHPFGYDPDEDL